MKRWPAALATALLILASCAVTKAPRLGKQRQTDPPMPEQPAGSLTRLQRLVDSTGCQGCPTCTPQLFRRSTSSASTPGSSGGGWESVQVEKASTVLMPRPLGLSVGLQGTNAVIYHWNPSAREMVLQVSDDLKTWAVSQSRKYGTNEETLEIFVDTSGKAQRFYRVLSTQ